MSRTTITAGEGLYGLPVMKFTLTYEGELRSNDDYRRKWEIRKYFHPQLEELWRIAPPLQAVRKFQFLPKGGWWNIEIHHSQPDERTPPRNQDELINLLEPLTVDNRGFFPLVRNSLALQCGLKILFLRKEEPGRVYQGGDLDNRLKTLLDALSVPNGDQIVDDPTLDGPIYCLLEDDELVKRLSVDTQRLLSRPNSSQHEVHLVIEVDVHVTQARSYNQPFLGD
jgi:hypothetical protein